MKNDYLCTHESKLANMTPNKHFNYYIERAVAVGGQGAYFS